MIEKLRYLIAHYSLIFFLAIIPPFTSTLTYAQNSSLNVSDYLGIFQKEIKLSEIYTYDPKKNVFFLDLTKQTLRLDLSEKTMMEVKTLKDLYSLVESVMDEKKKEKREGNKNYPIVSDESGNATIQVSAQATKTRANPLEEQEGAPPGIPVDQAMGPAEQTLEGGAITYCRRYPNK